MTCSILLKSSKTKLVMRKINFTVKARNDIRSIVIYISIDLDAPQTSRKRFNKLFDTLNLLSEQPLLGKTLDDDTLAHGPYYSFSVGDYKVFYTFDDDQIIVHRVLHSRQNIPFTHLL